MTELVLLQDVILVRDRLDLLLCGLVKGDINDDETRSKWSWY
jgi:hypothetical protein